MSAKSQFRALHFSLWTHRGGRKEGLWGSLDPALLLDTLWPWKIPLTLLTWFPHLWNGETSIIGAVPEELQSPLGWKLWDLLFLAQWFSGRGDWSGEILVGGPSLTSHPIPPLSPPLRPPTLLESLVSLFKIGCVPDRVARVANKKTGCSN